MCYRKSLCLAFALGSASIGLGQVRQDLSLRYELGSDRQLILEHRAPFANKFMIITGLTYAGNGNVDGSYPWWSQLPDIYNGSDTLIEMREPQVSRSGGDLRFGISRQIRWPIFSVRADVFSGYRREITDILSDYYEIQSSGTWISTSPPVSVSNRALRTVHRLNAGAMLSVHLDLPLGNRFFVNLFAAGSFTNNRVIAEEVVWDPLGEFTSPVWPGSSSDFNLRCGGGVRYRFGKETLVAKNDAR